MKIWSHTVVVAVQLVGKLSLSFRYVCTLGTILYCQLLLYLVIGSCITLNVYSIYRVVSSERADNLNYQTVSTVNKQIIVTSESNGSSSSSDDDQASQSVSKTLGNSSK